MWRQRGVAVGGEQKTAMNGVTCLEDVIFA
jgi:hypothetical protein